MRQTISGLVAVIAVMAASAVPAMACGGGLFQGGCSPCGQSYVSPCEQSFVPAPPPAPVYVAPPAPVYSGCNACGGGWAYERLPDPVHQYYYADQGPTYTGPGNFAPHPAYQEEAVPVWEGYRHHHYYSHYRPWRAHTGYRHEYRYGYAPHHGYLSHYSLPPRQFYGERHNMRYGGMMAHHYYSQREHMHRHY